MIGAVIFVGRTASIRALYFEEGWRRGSVFVQIRRWLSADSAGCPLGRFSHWWRSVWVSVFGERGVHTSVALASTVLLVCQKRGNCTLGQLMSPRFERVFFASFLCRFGQRNDVPPRTVANSDKENSQLMQTANAESSNPALTQTANPEPWQPGINPSPTTRNNPQPEIIDRQRKHRTHPLHRCERTNKKRCDALSDTAPIRASRSSVKTL